MDSLIAATTAAKRGSFSAAALELQTTHATVSRRVATAEEWVGLRLFERRARGVVPTSNGQRILARLEVALSQIRILAVTPDRRVRRRVPVVRLAVTPSFARCWLLPRLQLLQGDPADVWIEVVADLRYADLAGGEVELAIRYGRGGWNIGVESRLFEESLMPVATSDCLSRMGRSRAVDIAGLPLLHGGDTTNWRTWATTHEIAFHPKPEDRVFADSSLALDAARASLGVALWNRTLHAVDSSLVVLDELGVTSELAYFLVSRAGNTYSPAAVVAERIRCQCRATST